MAALTVGSAWAQVDTTAVHAGTVLSDLTPTNAAPTDTVPAGEVPTVSYTLTPKRYTIAGIQVTGTKNYDDFILIGRCGNVVYGDRPNCVRVFLCGEFAARVKVLRERYSLSQSTAEERVRENDENRLAYHKYYTGEVWGKADQYDLTINSCRLGFIRTEELIEHYVDQVLGR